jgi:hypothetical protein
LVIPSDIQQMLESFRTEITVLESILESLSPGENIKSNDAAEQIAEQLSARKPKLSKLIEDNLNEGNEKLVETLLLLFERVEKILHRYNVAAGKPTSYVPEERQQMEEEEEDDEEDEEDIIGLSNAKSEPTPVQSSNPIDLGLDMLAQITTKKDANQSQKAKDPFLAWLMSSSS